MSKKAASTSEPMLVTDDEVLALAFEGIGIRAEVIKEKDRLMRFLREKEAELPDLVFMNESVAEASFDYRWRLLRRKVAKPIFAVVPDLKKPRGLRLPELKKLIERSLGYKGLKI